MNSKRLAKRGFPLALLSLLVVTACLLAQSRAQQVSPAEKRLRQFLDALNSPNETALRTLIDEGWSKNPAVPIKPEERLVRLKTLRADKAPFKLVDILDARPLSAVALLKDKQGEQIGLKVEVETDAPHRIRGIRLGDPEELKETRPVREITHWKNLDDLLTQIRADAEAPALAAAIVQNGKISEQAVVGVREQGKTERAEPNDRWHLGSVTKPMTSTLVALLIEQGRLRWNSTLAELLPDVKMRPEYKGVTIEQLMQHRSGLPQDMNFTAATVERITKNATTPTALRGAYIADMLQRDPVGEPGERFGYSNAGYSLLGHIAERTAGKPYEQLMKERLFLPLGMKTAVVGESGAKGQPQGHRRAPEGLRVANFTGKLPTMTAPAGSVLCSIGDFARFAAFHLDGLRGKDGLLKAETVRRLHASPAVPPGREKYACGWEIVWEEGPEPFHGHGGSNGTFRA
jgi:CubicO group peptidase (beta-lactamase class C family)